MVFSLPVPAFSLTGIPLSSHYNGRSRVSLYSALQKDLEQMVVISETHGEAEKESKENSAWLQTNYLCFY